MDSMHVYFQQSLHCTLYHTAVTFQIQGLEGCLNQPSGEMRAGQQVGLHAWIWFHTLLFLASSSVIPRNLFWTVNLLSFLFQVSTLKSGHAFLHWLFIACSLVTEETEDLAITSSSVAALGICWLWGSYPQGVVMTVLWSRDPGL